MQDVDAWQRECQPAGDREGAVGARVVGDHDPPAERKALGQVTVEAADRLREDGLLVVHGHDDLHERRVPLLVGRSEGLNLGRHRERSFAAEREKRVRRARELTPAA